MVDSVKEASFYRGPEYPRQTTPPVYKQPPGTYTSPIPGYRPDPDPLGFPLNPQPPGNKRGADAGLSANLSNFMRQYNSGHNVLDDEMYKYFDGDNILSSLQKHDPNAKWSDVEGGRRLDFDASKLPNSKMPNGKEVEWMNLRPSNWGDDGDLMINKNAQWDDSNWGKVTHAQNFKKPKQTWETWAPLAVGLGAPMLGGLAAGAGIGGTAGLTAGVTGSGVGGSLPSWLTNAVRGMPQTARNAANGQVNPMQIAGLGANALGVGGGIMGQLSRYLPLAQYAAAQLSRNRNGG